MDTRFAGRFTLDKPLTAEHKEVLDDFYDTEHVYGVAIGSGWETPPGIYCQWMPTEDGMGLEWDGVEKFYSPAEWLEYLISHFLKPWGYVLNGSVEWVSTIYEPATGTIHVRDNRISVTSEPPLEGRG